MSLSLSCHLTNEDGAPWQVESQGSPVLAPAGRPQPTWFNNNESVCFVPRYLKYTLDQYVESDYTIVYFHYGLNSRNKPSLRWLQTAYKEFDRKCVPWALGRPQDVG